MIPILISDILTVTGGSLLCGGREESVTSVTTDSRKAREDALFVAICGERVDGHDFIEQAFLSGASCALVEKSVKTAFAEKTIILVENSVRAMGALARLVMEKLNVPTVGITGSVGKTTTRDMTYAVMAQKYNTLKNSGNFNNEIGVPLTVFEADESITAAVIEMGMDNFGEIDRLSKMVVPDAAIITNIGMSHIERLGSQEGIYKAKSEIFANTKHDGVVILNGDDKILMAHKSEISQSVITIGVQNKDADLVATDIKSDEKSVSFVLCGLGHTFSVVLPVPGEHNVLNALLAVAAGIHFGVSDEKIKMALETFSLTQMRMDIIRSERLTIINDCYNAAPDSVAAALSVLSKYKERKVAVLGDIKALGSFSSEAHFALGNAVTSNGINLLFTIGEQARLIAEGAFQNGMDSLNIFSVDTVEEIYPILSAQLKDNDVALVKASRAMGLERVTEFLKHNF